MKLFGTIYDKVMAWSKHRLAEYWLFFVSFIEAIFFPIPADVMLMPMSMSKPERATRYAISCTVASVLGGLIGYGIGYFAFDWVQGIIANLGYQASFDRAISWFEQWGVWVIFFIGGFSPIPYKICTICAGVMQMAFLPFVLAAATSRFIRFFLVAKVAAWGGKKYEEKLHRSIEWIGWATIALMVVAYGIYEFTK